MFLQFHNVQDTCSVGTQSLPFTAIVRQNKPQKSKHLGQLVTSQVIPAFLVYLGLQYQACGKLMASEPELN